MMGFILLSCLACFVYNCLKELVATYQIHIIAPVLLPAVCLLSIWATIDRG